jgi:hypothetical protein
MRRIHLLLSGALLVAALATDSSGYALRGGVMGNGGTPAAGLTGNGRVVYGTAGQAVVGTSAGAVYSLCHGYWCFGGVRVVAVLDPPVGSSLPAELAFGPATPNPAHDDVRFELALPKAARVALAIYDLQGRRVQDAAGPLAAGRHTLRWDGLDAERRTRRSGVYFARLSVDGALVAGRTIVLTR